MLSIIDPMICYKNNLRKRGCARRAVYGARGPLAFIQGAHRTRRINTYYRHTHCRRALPRKILHFPFYCLLLSFVSNRKPFDDNAPAGAARWALSSVEKR